MPNTRLRNRQEQYSNSEEIPEKEFYNDEDGYVEPEDYDDDYNETNQENAIIEYLINLGADEEYIEEFIKMTPEQQQRQLEHFQRVENRQALIGKAKGLFGLKDKIDSWDKGLKYSNRSSRAIFLIVALLGITAILIIFFFIKK